MFGALSTAGALLVCKPINNSQKIAAGGRHEVVYSRRYARCYFFGVTYVCYRKVKESKGVLAFGCSS